MKFTDVGGGGGATGCGTGSVGIKVCNDVYRNKYP